MTITATISLTALAASLLVSCSGPATTTWTLAELVQSPPCELTPSGAPAETDSPLGPALHFNGKFDGLLLGCNPLDGLTTFTVEVIFYPDSDGPTEQRFLHFGSLRSDRVLLETRVTPDGQWYLDTYIQSGETQQTLIDPKLLHPADRWYHAAYVVEEGRLQNYVNGAPELTADIPAVSVRGGSTSLGVRLTREFWFKGAIHSLRISPAALTPDQFLEMP